MSSHKDRRNAYALKTTLAMAAVGAALSLTAFTSEAQAQKVASSMATVNQSPSTQVCAAELPALQRAATGEQSGHLEALKTLESCDTQLGRNSAATFDRWLADRELDRADPHDQ
jgi:hypothetical protein